MSTRSQRRARARDQRAHDSRNPGRFVHAPAEMLDNPNRGKHGCARLDILGERADERIAEARHDYRPLTVRTPVMRADGRMGKRSTAYTI